MAERIHVGCSRLPDSADRGELSFGTQSRADAGFIRFDLRNLDHEITLSQYVLYGVSGNVFVDARRIRRGGEDRRRGKFHRIFRIYLPLVRNLFFTVMLLQGIYFWNDFQTPLLYLPTYPTLAYWLYRFTENTKVELSFVPVKAAGAMLLVVPIFILFAAFNKKMMGNLSLGGLKE